MGSTTRPRATSAWIIAGCVALAMSACSGADAEEKTTDRASESASADDGPQILRLADAQSLLLGAGDVGKGFKPQDSAPDLEADTNGCLGIFDQAQTNHQFEVESTFNKDGVTVTSQVTTYATAAEPKGDLLRFRKAVRSCQNFEQIRGGAVYDLSLEFNETVTTDFTQDQFNVAGTGTLTRDGEQLPLSFRYTLNRVDNNVVGVNIASVGPNPDELSELVRLDDLLVERLIELVGEPDDSADPDASESPSDEASDEPSEDES